MGGWPGSPARLSSCEESHECGCPRSDSFPDLGVYDAGRVVHPSFLCLGGVSWVPAPTSPSTTSAPASYDPSPDGWRRSPVPHIKLGAPGLAGFQTWEATIPHRSLLTVTFSAGCPRACPELVEGSGSCPDLGGDRVRHASSVKLVVARRGDQGHTSPVMIVASRVSNPRDPGHP